MLYSKFHDQLASVAEQSGLSLTWSQNLEDRFYHDMFDEFHVWEFTEKPILVL